MIKKRIIARIDVKNEHVIKGIQLEGLRKVGFPNELAKKYYNDGVDEIVFMDAVAAYYDRNSLSDVISKASDEIFVPITVGGGIRTIDDVSQALSSGADKVAINTKALQNPEFITEVVSKFGSQCVVLSIDAKKVGDNKWEAYFDNGREPSGKDVLEWCAEVEKLGAGEILLTSVDMEGTKKGFDENLIDQLENKVSIPVTACGGAGKLSHITSVFKNTNIDAVAIASVLHYSIASVSEVKSELSNNGVRVRR